MSRRSERACMICGIIQEYKEFVSKGCPNCDSLLAFTNDDILVQDCTSPSFEGQVAICDTSNSWVARWLRVDGFEPGLYAVKVKGRLPEDIIGDLGSKGVIYRPRDGSAQE